MHQSEMVGAFFMPEEICFLCPFLRKEVSTVANRIMGITDKLLKLDPGNTELLAQKQKLLADAVGETKEKLASSAVKNSYANRI